MNLRSMTLFTSIILAGVVLFGKVHAQSITANDLLSWPRMEASEFGCMLEKKLHFKDKNFNCANVSVKHNWGDPCKDTNAYYSGPVLPENFGKEIDSSIHRVQLAWEHGQLQHMTVEFNKVVTKKEVERIFGFKLSRPYPKNVQSVDLKKCSKNASCLSLEGFDHMGAGEWDCGGSDGN
jgi:hypothetical protein